MCTTVSHHHHHQAPARPKNLSAPERAYRVETVTDAQGQQEILSVSATAQTVRQDEVVLRSQPLGFAEHGEAPSPESYKESYIAESALTPEQRQKLEDQQLQPQAEWAGSEVRTIVNQGPSQNRIDLTIVGDGYTDAEKSRFFEDAKRLTDDMFVGQTFASYLPLFNVHAVFVPSKESGLTDTTRKDTALKLHRSPAGSKRGILPGDRRAAERAVSLAPDTDYPILVANDDFYGGLGGRYAITTRSHNSGTMVLRHELGHNFGNVGEEYDGGQVYSGANHSSSANVPWQQWVSADGKVFEAQALATGYPWKNLSQGDISLDFKVPPADAKGPKKIGIDVSSVGWEKETDVEILIDGVPQKYTGVFTEDRSFFYLKEATSFAPGNHRLTVREKTKDGNNVVAAIRINAYPADYDFAPDKVGGFPSFNVDGRHVGYRPTHESCLMRNMRSTEFCSVDQENMWHQFLNRVDLIDAVQVEPDQSGGSQTVTVETPSLEGLDVRWFKKETDAQGRSSEVEVESQRGQKTWQAGPGDSGDYRVEVRFATDEVRKYSERFRTEETFQIA
jgi:hypothetical protein